MEPQEPTKPPTVRLEPISHFSLWILSTLWTSPQANSRHMAPPPHPMVCPSIGKQKFRTVSHVLSHDCPVDRCVFLVTTLCSSMNYFPDRRKPISKSQPLGIRLPSRNALNHSLIYAPTACRSRARRIVDSTTLFFLQ